MKNLLLIVISICVLQSYLVESGVGRSTDPTYDIICGQRCIEPPFNGTEHDTQCCKSYSQICCREIGHRHSCYSCKQMEKKENPNTVDITDNH